ncbi:hypothetical protein HY256_01620 [Candidatus Sumerlaeota bacterium]|nr:hypothetical protein [Candidatus Sumerlaeota bacterium]
MRNSVQRQKIPPEFDPISFPQILWIWVTTALRIFPIGLREDVLYLWASFRLRRKPLKVMSWVAMLGLICYGISWAGTGWLYLPMSGWISQLQRGDLRDVLHATAGAIFSSLNILSCLSIIIIWLSMRKLMREGHLEALMLTPRRFRPSALHYAIATRYLPLAFLALLVEYLNPTRTPFRHYPFGGNFAEPLPDGALLWAAYAQLSILIFCVTNLFADLTVGFWAFCRFSVSYLTLILALLFVGIAEPILLMWLKQSLEASHPFIFNINSMSYGDRLNVLHYGWSSAISVAVTVVLLFDADLRWSRILRSRRRDPILLRRRFWGVESDH